MAIQFPANPVFGQSYQITSSGLSYSWDGSTWNPQVVATSAITLSGSVAGQFVQVQRKATDQTSIGSTATLIFDSCSLSNGIPYNTSTGVFTLTAGKTYELMANLSMGTFSAASAYQYVQWVDSTTNTPLLPDAWTFFEEDARTTNSYAQTNKIIYTPATNQTIALKTSTGSGTMTMFAGGSIATIQEVNPPINTSVVGNFLASASFATTATEMRDRLNIWYTSQTSMNTVGTAVVSQIGLNSAHFVRGTNIRFESGSHTIVLQPGLRYRLEATPGFFASGNTSTTNFNWIVSGSTPGAWAPGGINMNRLGSATGVANTNVQAIADQSAILEITPTASLRLVLSNNTSGNNYSYNQNFGSITVETV